MLTYVADVFGHALIVSFFLFGDKLRYNEGSFFVKLEFIPKGGQLRKSVS